MNEPTISDRVLGVIRRALLDYQRAPFVPIVHPDSTLELDLGMDVITRSGLGLLLDDEFDISVGDTCLHGWDTAADVIATVERLAKQEAA